MGVPLLFFFLILYYQHLFGQDSSCFLDVLSISVNQTHLKNYNTENRYGFGLGAYHIFRNDKIVNLVFGLEYNRNSQLKKHVYEGRFQHSVNVTYYINYLSFPLSCRFNLGNKFKLFVEAGGFIDINLGSRMKGT